MTDKTEKPNWWPENPYPEELFPNDAQEYCDILIDPTERTAISGYLGRIFWNLAAKQFRTVIELQSDPIYGNIDHWWPENPYPIETFTCTRERFEIMFPIIPVRTRCAALVAHHFWEMTSETIWDRLQDHIETLKVLDGEVPAKYKFGDSLLWGSTVDKAIPCVIASVSVDENKTTYKITLLTGDFVWCPESQLHEYPDKRKE